MKKILFSTLSLASALLCADTFNHTYTMDDQNSMRATFQRDFQKVAPCKDGFKGQGFRVKVPAGEKGFTVHTIGHQETSLPVEISLKGMFKGKGSFTMGFIVRDPKGKIYWIKKGVYSFSKQQKVDSEKWQEFSYVFRPSEEDVKKIKSFLPAVSVNSGSDIVMDELELRVVERTVKTAASELKLVPYTKTAPDMRGKFLPSQWRKALKLSNFVQQKSGGKISKDPTMVYLLRDAQTLYIAATLDGENVPELIKQQVADRKKAVYQVSRLEMFLGERAYLQFIMDYMGRTYCSTDQTLFYYINHKRKSIIIRVAIPIKAIPTLAISPDVVNVNFYRQGPSGISSWAPNDGQFVDMTQTLPIFLESPEKIVRRMTSSYTTQLSQLKAAGTITAKDASTLTEAVDRLAKQCLASKTNVKGFLKHLGEFSKINTLIGNAQESCLKTRFGTTKTLLAKPFSGKIPAPWLPGKLKGKDFHYAYTILPGYADPAMEEAGMMKLPLYRDAMFHVRFFQGSFSTDMIYPEKRKQKAIDHYKFLKKYPNNLLLIGADRGINIDPKNPGIKNIFDKEYMKKFDALYGKRVVGFSSPESFISSREMYMAYYRHWNLPKANNRVEAYNNMKKLYDIVTPTIPKYCSFRNVALMSPYTRKYAAWNTTADIFNHTMYSFGDRISGNENGECMGATPPKYAFSRGAARQFGGIWENYQVYYGWAYIDSPNSGGMQAASTTGMSLGFANRQLTPDCRVKSYCNLNGLYVGTALERQKAQILHPYLNGVGIWRSEADLNELVAAYDVDEIKNVDPLVINLRDQKFHISPMAKINLHFYDNIVMKRDRGVAVTPVALVYDRHNGYSPLYFGQQVWGLFPPTEQEKIMWALNRHVYKRNTPNQAYATSPYGDIFDIITNDAPARLLETYQALYLTGDVTLDKAFASRLESYVKQGGTLIINGELLAKYRNALSPRFLGCTITNELRKSPGTYSRLTGKVIGEKQPYTYRVLKAGKKTEILAVTTDVAQNPAILLHPFGKGKVIVTAPCHMKANGNMESMLAIFDEIMVPLRDQTLAIKVDTIMQYSINRNKNSWIVYLQNNEGIPPSNGVFKGPLKCDPKVRTSGKITIPGKLGKVKKVIDWWSGKELPLRQEKDGSSVSVTLRSGDCCALEFVMK